MYSQVQVPIPIHGSTPVCDHSLSLKITQSLIEIYSVYEDITEYVA